jgi:hypothetical protein
MRENYPAQVQDGLLGTKSDMSSGVVVEQNDLPRPENDLFYLISSANRFS